MRVKLHIWFVFFAMAFIYANGVVAQQFGVNSFRELANDITAYINPVTDLNGEACALVKVECSSDFAFSSPLGIVKRINEVGEVWLYLPKGSILLTLKHPQWGVVRDYKFSKALESRVTYELKLNTPALQIPKDSVVVVQKDTVLVKDVVLERDTVVIQRIVEVDKREVKKERTPLKWGLGVSAHFGKGSLAYGFKVMARRKHGLYLGGLCNFNSVKTVGECNGDGLAADGAEIPYDTGDVGDSRYALILGGVHMLGKNISFYEGVGYGERSVAYKKVTDEWWLNTDDSCSGFAAEAGVAYQIKQFSISVGVTTICGRYWEPAVGLFYIW